MDERDEEWLTKNNEEARGEGTSAQGALSVSTTRSGRGTKAKGKDPEVLQATVMSEDEFELVISIFEKVTHEKTEFLHHVGVLSQLVTNALSLILCPRVLSRARLSLRSLIIMTPLQILCRPLCLRHSHCRHRFRNHHSFLSLPKWCIHTGKSGGWNEAGTLSYLLST